MTNALIIPITGTKECKLCSQIKPLGEFHKHNGLKDGRNTYCKECAIQKAGDWQKENPQKTSKKNKKWKKANYAASRGSRLKKLYPGKTALEAYAEYNKLFIEQEGRCSICKKHQDQFKRKLALDHSHSTGKVRGLLCNKCNTALGSFGDSIETLANAIQYLELKNGK